MVQHLIGHKAQAQIQLIQQAQQMAQHHHQALILQHCHKQVMLQTQLF